MNFLNHSRQSMFALILSLTSFVGMLDAQAVPIEPASQVFSIPAVQIPLDQKSCFRYSGCFTARLNLQCAALKQIAKLETTLQCSGNLEYYNDRKGRIVSVPMAVLRTTYLADGHFELKFGRTVEQLSIIGTIQRGQEVEFRDVVFSQYPGESDLKNTEIKSVPMKPFVNSFDLEYDPTENRSGAHSKIDAVSICHRHFYDSDAHIVGTYTVGRKSYINWECWGTPELYK